MHFDRYDIARQVGAGGHAAVYEATDPRFDSPVAIKVLAEQWSADPLVVERFGQEARLLRRVRSERRNAPLVEVFDIDQTPEGQPYFVMSFADRGTLAERMVAGEPWPDANVSAVVRTVADGLEALHASGVVHRDIKPSNLLYVTQVDAPNQEELLIGDLGLAKDLQGSTSELTLAGGTPGYMAPEQLRPDAQVTPAADVYAASVMVCELLSGHRGQSGLADLTPPLRAELTRGMAPDPGQRHRSIVEWRDRLLPLLGAGNSPAVVADGAKERFGSRRVLAGVAALAVVVALVVGALFWDGGGEQIRIIGPAQTRVGESIVLRADVPPDGVHFWTVAGERVVDADLRLAPEAPGEITVQLGFTASDGSTENTETVVTVTP